MFAVSISISISTGPCIYRICILLLTPLILYLYYSVSVFMYASHIVTQMKSEIRGLIKQDQQIITINHSYNNVYTKKYVYHVSLSIFVIEILRLHHQSRKEELTVKDKIKKKKRKRDDDDILESIVNHASITQN